MTTFKKNGMTMAARDKNQAAAFLNNGWKQIENVVSNDVEGKVETTKLPDNVVTHYTKTDINRLSTAELKELAAKEGISNIDNKSGGELKKELIEHYGL